ncbi:hypothetical protein M0R19_05175 [Candidatus Pacearchaeota archaeon]|jgi:hypothetical protein|nr:hypothetical protein [Candidatus Pacearchaeota archaeon]
MTNSSIWGYRPPCPGCGGAKIQINKDGINIRCPFCNGTGIESDTGLNLFVSSLAKKKKFSIPEIGCCGPIFCKEKDYKKI